MPEYIYMDGLEEYESYIEVEDIHVQMKRSLGSEKQISVDPISLGDSVSSSSSSSSGNKAKEELDIFHLKPPSAKPKFLSYSLPNSATSSPKFGMSNKKKAKNHLNQEDPIVRVNNPIYRQNSVALTNLERLREIHLRRSKSCGDGRASIPPEEFDLWPPVKKTNYLEEEGKMVNKEKDAEAMETYDEKFKCGALCLFLPSLGKAKPIRARKTEPEPEVKAETQAESGGLQVMVVSKRVSLEKFECGSWRSSAILDDSEGFNKDGSSNLFYELPLEMIHCSGGGSGHVDDTNSPVTSAFVFDKDRKGVLKKNSSRITTPKKKSPDSSRHVRFSFSTSSPKSHPASPTSSCVTPRLLKARDDFNAFLEAQAA